MTVIYRSIGVYDVNWSVGVYDVKKVTLISSGPLDLFYDAILVQGTEADGG